MTVITLLPGIKIPNSKYYDEVLSLFTVAALKEHIAIYSWERSTGAHKLGRSIDISRVYIEDEDGEEYKLAELSISTIDMKFNQWLNALIDAGLISQILTPSHVYDLRIKGTDKLVKYDDDRVPSYLKPLQKSHRDHIHITVKR